MRIPENTRISIMYNLDKANAIHGWMSEPELLFLASLASKSKYILEAGSFKGRSTRALADNTDGIVYAIDPWNGRYTSKDHADLALSEYNGRGGTVIFEEFLSNMRDLIDSKKLVAYRMQFTQFRLQLDPDLIFIDGAHDYEYVKADIQHAKRLMKHGIIAGHDYVSFWPSVKQAVNEEFPNNFVVSDSIWYTEI